MKIEDIKKAYDSVSANDDLKAKVFSRLESETENVSQSVLPQLYAETEEDIPKMEIEMSHIQRKKGGGSRLAATAFFAAAMIALVFVIRKTTFDVEIVTPPAEVTETTVSEVVEIPENTALVTLRLVDENGIPVKNMRIDYLPAILIKEEDSQWDSSWHGLSFAVDMENFDKRETIPLTYGRDIELLIPYGDYIFNISDAMPNAEYFMQVTEQVGMIAMYGETRSSTQFVKVDESTEEIVLTEWGGNKEYEGNLYPKLIVTLQDAMGVPLPDYTVILKPTDGVMMEGYNDKYGGYVLTVTDENGEAFWRNTPISGEYEVIAYKEELHTADEPILEPFVFDGDNTFSYVPNDTVIIDEKTFRMAE